MCDKLLCIQRNPVAAAKAVPSPSGRNSSYKRGPFGEIKNALRMGRKFVFVFPCVALKGNQSLIIDKRIRRSLRTEFFRTSFYVMPPRFKDNVLGRRLSDRLAFACHLNVGFHRNR